MDDATRDEFIRRMFGIEPGNQAVKIQSFRIDPEHQWMPSAVIELMIRAFGKKADDA